MVSAIFVSWILAGGMLMLGLHYLPFINLDASFRLQHWLRDQLRKLNDINDDLSRKNRDL